MQQPIQRLVLLRCSVHLTIKPYLTAVTLCVLGKILRRFGGIFYLYFEDMSEDADMIVLNINL